MDYDRGYRLWHRMYLPDEDKKTQEILRNKDDRAREFVSKLALPLRNREYIFCEADILTIVHISDNFNSENKPYRTTVRTETIPNANIPRPLINILNRLNFKKRNLS